MLIAINVAALVFGMYLAERPQAKAAAKNLAHTIRKVIASYR